MAKRHPKTLKAELQKLLDRKYINDDGTQHTGAELIALVLFAQAQDPTSPHYGKALDIVTKLTHTSEREKLQAEKLQIEVTARAAPVMNYDLDPFSQSIMGDVQNAPLMPDDLYSDDIPQLTDDLDEGDDLL